VSRTLTISLVILAVCLLVSSLAFVFVIERLEEPAMTSCVIPRELRGVPTVTIGVQHRLLPPWKFDCVFYARGGEIVAKTRAPYP
jgi:hypothetical protein